MSKNKPCRLIHFSHDIDSRVTNCIADYVGTAYEWYLMMDSNPGKYKTIFGNSPDGSIKTLLDIPKHQSVNNAIYTFLCVFMRDDAIEIVNDIIKNYLCIDTVFISHGYLLLELCFEIDNVDLFILFDSMVAPSFTSYHEQCLVQEKGYPKHGTDEEKYYYLGLTRKHKSKNILGWLFTQKSYHDILINRIFSSSGFL